MFRVMQCLLQIIALHRSFGGSTIFLFACPNEQDAYLHTFSAFSWEIGSLKVRILMLGLSFRFEVAVCRVERGRKKPNISKAAYSLSPLFCFLFLEEPRLKENNLPSHSSSRHAFDKRLIGLRAVASALFQGLRILPG